MWFAGAPWQQHPVGPPLAVPVMMSTATPPSPELCALPLTARPARFLPFLLRPPPMHERQAASTAACSGTPAPDRRWPCSKRRWAQAMASAIHAHTHMEQPTASALVSGLSCSNSRPSCAGGPPCHDVREFVLAHLPVPSAALLHAAVALRGCMQWHSSCLHSKFALVPNHVHIGATHLLDERGPTQLLGVWRLKDSRAGIHARGEEVPLCFCLARLTSRLLCAWRGPLQCFRVLCLSWAPPFTATPLFDVHTQGPPGSLVSSVCEPP